MTTPHIVADNASLVPHMRGPSFTLSLYPSWSASLNLSVLADYVDTPTHTHTHVDIIHTKLSDVSETCFTVNYSTLLTLCVAAFHCIHSEHVLYVD